MFFRSSEAPPDELWFCFIGTTSLWIFYLCSTLFILSMTFERFYSIIQLHKSASFNTIRKARITIACITAFSIVFNVPHGYFTLQVGNVCIPFGNSDRYQLGEVYYWLYSIVNFLFPFVSMLIMNIVIIYTLRKRSSSDIGRSGAQRQGQGKTKIDEKYTRMKNIEKQIFKTLLLPTFLFLVFECPRVRLHILRHVL